MELDRLRVRRRRSRTALVFGAALLVASTIQKFPVPLGGANVYLPHLVAVVLFPIFFYGERIVGKVRNVLLFFAISAIVAALPSLTLELWDVRLSLILQILLNVFTFIVSFALFRQLTIRDLEQLIIGSSLVLVLAAGAQLVIAPGVNPRTETTFGLAHPILLFNEETWLALFAALLAVCAYGIGARKAGHLLSLMVIFIGTRSAMIVVAVSVAMTVQGLATRKWVRFLCASSPIAFALWFVFDSVFATTGRVYNDTLDTRAADISAVRQANNDDFLPFGGEVVSVFDFSRSRLVPATSNVQSFELFWKFGLGGLAIVALFAALVSVILPRLALSSSSKGGWPVWLPLMVWPAMLQFNNAFGFPWMWVMLALCIAVLAVEAREEISNASTPQTMTFGRNRT
ncbi:hypothetical protein Asphe3_30610 [Pseudarthrobacter phenanthrenivorans Sphe3]|uniref:Uncharacterized protein n=1 Tax=Pseudarthrobacter phenanthrenivorans (strain DSM 18606 / JCM 16027 / LMG 23796 / Sphe3) TaxID=930171 RepID=F0M1H5_PSEPM|nr:hypothetical protein [Pseudarthrobacter phenanthrenivorans]ADX74171.1 hypothetical protein Asphe3_30610 [Pseudarthrobacter phenanthrenivorans Sphe3]